MPAGSEEGLEGREEAVPAVGAVDFPYNPYSSPQPILSSPSHSLYAVFGGARLPSTHPLPKINIKGSLLHHFGDPES